MATYSFFKYTDSAKKSIHILRDIIYVLCVYFLAPTVFIENAVININFFIDSVYSTFINTVFIIVCDTHMANISCKNTVI